MLLLSGGGGILPGKKYFAWKWNRLQEVVIVQNYTEPRIPFQTEEKFVSAECMNSSKQFKSKGLPSSLCVQQHLVKSQSLKYAQSSHTWSFQLLTGRLLQQEHCQGRNSTALGYAFPWKS